jgi:tetratricopeptide (TPR) repeat protein
MGEATTKWRLHLFSTFMLERDGQVVVTFSKRRQDLLMALIALGGQGPQARTDIATRLWPRSSRSLRQNRLTEVLFRLNRELREAGVDIGIIETDHVIFKLSSLVRTDVQDFDDTIARAVMTSDLDERRDLLEEAIALFGTGLLPLISDPALQDERERLSSARDYAAEMLVGALPETRQRGSVGATVHIAAADLARYYVRGKELGADTGGGPLETPPPLTYGAPALRTEEWAPTTPNMPDLLRRCVQLAAEVEPHLFGPEYRLWLDRLDVKRDEIHAALDWALDHHGAEDALRIAGDLWRYWYYRHRCDDGLRYLQRSMVLVRQVDTPIYAKAAHGAGALAVEIGDLDLAERWFREALAVWRRLEDAEAIGRVLVNLGFVTNKRGDYPAARAAYSEGLSVLRLEGRETVLGDSLKNAALMELADGNKAAAALLFQERIEIGRRLNDNGMVASTLLNLAAVVMDSHGYDEVKSNAEEARRLFQGLGDVEGVATCLRLQGWLAQENGQLDVAGALYDASYTICCTIKDKRGIGESFRCLAELSLARGDTDQAVSDFRKAMLLLNDISDQAAAKQAQAALDKLMQQELL